MSQLQKPNFLHDINIYSPPIPQDSPLASEFQRVITHKQGVASIIELSNFTTVIYQFDLAFSHGCINSTYQFATNL